MFSIKTANYLLFFALQLVRNYCLLEDIVRERAVESVRDVTVKVQTRNWALIDFLCIQNHELSHVIARVVELRHDPAIVLVHVALCGIEFQRIYARDKNRLADHSEFFSRTPYLI